MGRETVIKKAETRKRVGVPMMVMGVLMFFITLVIALALAGPFVVAMASFFKQPVSTFGISTAFVNLDFPTQVSLIFSKTPMLIITAVLWLMMLALSYALVASIAGRDPEGPEAMKMVMSGIDARKAENRRKARMRH